MRATGKEIGKDSVIQKCTATLDLRFPSQDLLDIGDVRSFWCMLSIFLQEVVLQTVREAKYSSLEVLTQQRRLRVSEQLSLFDGVRRNRKNIAAAHKHGTSHLTVHWFCKSNRAAIERYRKDVAIEGNVTNAVDLCAIEPDFRKLSYGGFNVGRSDSLQGHHKNYRGQTNRKAEHAADSIRFPLGANLFDDGPAATVHERGWRVSPCKTDVHFLKEVFQLSIREQRELQLDKNAPGIEHFIHGGA